MEAIECGSLVIVKGFGERAFLRWAWGEEDGYVLIHDEAEYQKRLAGLPFLQPIPFRRKDVFPCPTELVEGLKTDGWSAPWGVIDAALKTPA